MASSPSPSIAADFREATREYLTGDLKKIRVVWAGLTEEQIWHRYNEHTLAPANQLIHLAGNLRQWVLTHLGGQPDVRERDSEFAIRGGRDKADILGDFETAMAQVLNQLDAPVDVGKPLRIQGHDTTPTGVWVHVTEHLSYHTGQLIFHAKSLRDTAYDFYADWDLTASSPSPAPPPFPAATDTSARQGLREHFAAYVQLLATGSFLAAIDRFYAGDIVQYENAEPPTHGKEALLLAERRAERRIASADIQIKDAVIDAERQLVWGEMDIHFVSERGVEQRLREAFRQNWRDGRIVEQRFYYYGFRDV